MATKKKASTPQIDFAAIGEVIKGQFQGLNPNEPGQWPLLPRLTAFAVLAILVVFACWFLLLSDKQDELQSARDKEPTLKSDYRAKLGQAINLPELRKQKSQVEEYVTQLEKQLPGRAEMDALLSDITVAGRGRSLQFELFKPGQVVVKDYYAELPISLKVTGRFHDIGSFAGDVANLSRIVTLNNINILAGQGKDASNILTLDATARTYRYLDATEVADQRKSVSKGAKK